MEPGRGVDPRVEALRSVLAILETCLVQLDRLGAGLTGVRLNHSIENLRSEIGVGAAEPAEADYIAAAGAVREAPDDRALEA